MKKNGFTLIEMVIVIILVGIIAAVALPRFINLNSEAGQKATEGLAAALSAASAANYAKRSANSVAGNSISDCSEVGGLLTQALPNEYNITGGVITSGQAKQCTLTRSTGEMAHFTGMGVS